MVVAFHSRVLVAVVACLATTSVASAQEFAPVQGLTLDEAPPMPPHVRTADDVRSTSPYLVLGYATLGASYGAGFVAAAHGSDPTQLWMAIPLAGPWLSLGDRPTCGATSASGCGRSTATSTLIVADGLGQALGALMILGSWVTSASAPDAHADRAVPVATMHVSPASMGSGAYGLLAFGTF